MKKIILIAVLCYFVSKLSEARNHPSWVTAVIAILVGLIVSFWGSWKTKVDGTGDTKA